jgi:predicted amidohydrolase YtcJ
MAKLGVSVSVQPLVVGQSGDLYTEILGHERARRAIPVRSLIDAGLRPAVSSDAPVSSIDPFANIRSMATRMTANGVLLGADQILDVAESIRCMTENAAFIGHREQELGMLEVGMLADLVVLSDDPFQASDAVNGCFVDMTICDGNVLFDRRAEL